jgi:hypothetical protein
MKWLCDKCAKRRVQSDHYGKCDKCHSNGWVKEGGK